MSAQLIQSLIPHLPRYAEEEGDFYSVPRDALIDAVCSQHPLDQAIAENTVNLLETLLESCPLFGVILANQHVNCGN
ncbi:MAG: hypothetical protein Q8N96_15195 [Methylovulum sp.]|nr:hypothetical protein [Methylovulum sp.]